MRDPTTMYFERWGLLAPPPEKASFEKDLPALLSPQRYYNTTTRGVPAQAFRRSGVQETKQASKLSPLSAGF